MVINSTNINKTITSHLINWSHSTENTGNWEIWDLLRLCQLEKETVHDIWELFVFLMSIDVFLDLIGNPKWPLSGFFLYFHFVWN